MPSSGYAAISFVANEQPTTAKWNLIGSNDASFNTGAGFNDSIILARHIAANVINSSHIDWTTSTPGGIWHQELTRVTAPGGSATMTTPTFTARKYLRLLINMIPSGAISAARLQFNGDTSNSYPFRVSTDGGVDSTGLTSGIAVDVADTNAAITFAIVDLINVAAQEKVANGIVMDANTAGTGNIPHRRIGFGKWSNTSAQITGASVVITGGNLNAGSEIIVLGHD